MSEDFEFQEARNRFPALQQQVGGQTAIYADGPGGTQVPRSVIEAIGEALELGISNLGGNFVTSVRADSMVRGARQAMADFLGASRAEEIVFGQNMTSLNFALSRSLSRDWGEGDEIILTRIDHDANISPWLKAAEDRGATVRWLPFGKESGELDLDALDTLVNERTKLIAVTYASNALGSISPIKEIVSAAHNYGALCVVDAVHYGPHGLIDVKDLDCDVLLCSAYKFFGPHIGIMYGKHELLSQWKPYKLRPVYDKAPEKWETGTQSIEALHGVTAAIDYIASLSKLDKSRSRRERLVAAMARINTYETELGRRFLDGVEAIEGLKVYGITDREALQRRTPTFALSLAGVPPGKVADLLGEQGIFVWSGHYYAMTVMEDMGLDDSGGLVRIGFVHYNSPRELDRIVAALTAIAASQG